MRKGTKVRVVKNPYAPMLNIPVGTEGVITKVPNVNPAAMSLVSVRFKGGPSVKCWLLKDNSGNRTLEAI